jgi:phytoene dehydrogenase-like protein
MANLFQGPLSAGTGYTLLHHLVGRERGAFGSRAFPTSERAHLPAVLAAVLKKLGVEIRLHTPATVAVEGRRAVGVTLASGEIVPARVVASGADPKRAFIRELAPSHLPPEFVRSVTHVKLRGVRATLMLAVDAAPAFRGVSADLAKGTLVRATSLEAIEHAFDDAKHGGISEAPALEITIPSLHDPSLAPSGKHVVHVAMQYAPYALGGSWNDAARALLTQRIKAALERLAPGIGASVIGEKLVTPLDLERDYGLTEGHLYGGELTLDQILFMRPVGGWAHYKTPLAGYFVCGEATHPGGAIVGLSGHHAAQRITRFLR